MTAGVAFWMAREFQRTHTNVLEAVDGLSDEQLNWRPSRSNSIAFNVWHIARWSDHLGTIVSGMTPAIRARMPFREELWVTERIAEKWGLPAEDLGQVETGMTMDEQKAATLALPPMATLQHYAERVFASTDAILASLRDEDLTVKSEIEARRVPWLEDPSKFGFVAIWLIVSLRHESRHLGMIEALKGAIGRRGTVTV